MKNIACFVLASVWMLPSCGTDKTTSPTESPAKPATMPALETTAKKTPPAPAVTPPAANAPEKPAPTPAAPATTPPVAPAETPKAAASVDMDAAIKTLMAQAELPDASIEVQHILIGFKGTLPGPTRSKEEAHALAQKVYSEVIGGANFDAAVKTYTNDSAPGIYPITKSGRTRMVKAFGDVGFRLKVGEIGVAPFDAAASPYGWHIIKRLK